MRSSFCSFPFPRDGQRDRSTLPVGAGSLAAGSRMAGEPRVLHPPLYSPRAKPGSHGGEFAGKLGSRGQKWVFQQVVPPEPSQAPGHEDPGNVALPFAHSPGSGCCWAVSGCSVHTDGVPGEPQAPQRSSAKCHGVGLCLSAAVTRGLQASFGRIIYTNIYISCLAGKALRCSSCTVGKRK